MNKFWSEFKIELILIPSCFPGMKNRTSFFSILNWSEIVFLHSALTSEQFEADYNYDKIRMS